MKSSQIDQYYLDLNIYYIEMSESVNVNDSNSPHMHQLVNTFNLIEKKKAA